jgi:hypothetical protein
LGVDVDLDVATVNSMGVMTRQVGLTTITFVKPRTISSSLTIIPKTIIILIEIITPLSPPRQSYSENGQKIRFFLLLPLLVRLLITVLLLVE